ncbi:MAG: hypothetical protein IPL46_08435 [Saprospiraceae bacterium]|nr:hypothetical protein [Saprospiraceae bacterium]
MTNISLRVPSHVQLLNNRWSAYLLFLIWPFFSVIYAVVNYRSPWAKNIIWLFSGFFGFTFVISNEGMDANSYRSYLEYLYESDITFSEYFVGVYQGIYSRGDYLEPAIR